MNPVFIDHMSSSKQVADGFRKAYQVEGKVDVAFIKFWEWGETEPVTRWVIRHEDVCFDTVNGEDFNAIMRPDIIKWEWI